jgi:hypothetical protein
MNGWDRYCKECTRFCNGQTVCLQGWYSLSTEQPRAGRNKDVLNEVSVKGGSLLWLWHKATGSWALARVTG